MIRTTEPSNCVCSNNDKLEITRDYIVSRGGEMQTERTSNYMFIYISCNVHLAPLLRAMLENSPCSFVKF